MSQEWRKCSICKASIKFGQIYQQCNVSTCRKNAYCSVDCWSVHVPVLNHKNAWAEEERAPKEGQEVRPKRRIIVTPKAENTPMADEKTHLNNQDIPKDILVVVSKLKAYIKARSDMNTSGEVADKLSDIIRQHVDQAINQARQSERITVMARDFK